MTVAFLFLTQTRRKPSWSSGVRDDGDPLPKDGSRTGSSTEQDSDVENQVDRANSFNDDPHDNGNTHDEIPHADAAPVDYANENIINENDVDERNGSATSSMGQCPFMTGSQLSMDSPAPSPGGATSAHRALSKSQLRGN